MQISDKGLLSIIYKQLVTLKKLSNTFKKGKRFEQKFHKWKYTNDKQAYEKMPLLLLIREMPMPSSLLIRKMPIKKYNDTKIQNIDNSKC